MRGSRQQRRIQRHAERIRREALDAGNLHDVSATARRCGLDVPVAISRRVWTNLVWPFPSARPGELVPLEDLLRDVHECVQNQDETPLRMRHVTPTVRPAWLSTMFRLRVQFNDRDDQHVAVIVYSEDECFAYKQEESPDLLPAALVVRLHRLVLGLSLVKRTADTKLVERMWAIAKILLRPSPAESDIKFHVTRYRPMLPASFTPEEYRLVLLKSLAELVVCLQACGSQAAYVTSLASFHREMASPLCDLAELTERLLQLAARMPQESGSRQEGPFRHLLAAFHVMQSALDRGQTAVYAQVLETLRRQFAMMQERLQGADGAELARLQKVFEPFDDGSPPNQVIDLAYREKWETVWQ